MCGGRRLFKASIRLEEPILDNILDYQKKFDNVQVFKLERNYRSTQKIVEAANSLMKHNVKQIPKEVYSKESEGSKISYHSCYSDKEEAMVVVKEIKKTTQHKSISIQLLCHFVQNQRTKS